MFPSSLQKNIRELDRQISLLETECDNMEAENRETSGKMNSKMLIREMPNRLFIPNSCPPQGVHSPKRFTLAPLTSRVHTSNCVHNRAIHSESKCLDDSQNPVNKSHSKGSEKKESSDGSGNREGCSEENPCGNAPYELRPANPGERKEAINASFEGKKTQKESGESLKVKESSDDNYPIRVEINTIKQKNVSTDTSKEQQSWCDLLKEKVLADNCQNRRSNKKTADDRESFFGRNPVEPKFSSEEDLGRNIRLATAESNFLGEKWAREFECPMISQSKISTKRRSRSARTRKKSDEVPMDVSINKAIHEKEIQCILWNEDREKTEFLQDLNESIRTLQLLMEDLKTKSTREKRNEVLNDMQNILMKLKSINALQNSLGKFSSLRGTDVRSMEGEEDFMDQKRALLAVKKFCQELSEEKSALTDELNTKNYKITNLKNKEKEYLSLISNLKFNLESLKEETEEGRLAKRDLLLMKAKLREEAKVIEVLKKSHGKMQALIEHYVLENDKLRAEMKMAKLESQKFHVLLAGKEVEITKYKQELELFQRQINQQLSLLRCKATEKEVEHTMEVISAQANILQTEVDSLPSETTFDKEEPSLIFDLTETTSSVRTQAEPRNMEEAQSKDLMSVPKREQEGGEESMKLSSSSRELKEVDVNLKDGGFTSCKSDDSLAEERVCDKYCLGLRGVLSSSKNLRSSVNEMLQDMRRGSSEKFWPSPPNSRNSSQCSAVSNYSVNASECSQRD